MADLCNIFFNYRGLNKKDERISFAENFHNIENNIVLN